MTNTAKAKYWFIKTALSYLGTPYIWGGDDPSGFDCSGYVLECLKSIGYCRETDDFTAHSLLQKLIPYKVVQKPSRGALLFYLNSQKVAYHVVICIDSEFQIGASGGDSDTTNQQIASQKNAYIKIRPLPKSNHNYIFINIFDF